MNEIQRLQEWIERKGWTKAEFARQMDIQPQNVSKYLSGSLKLDTLYGKLMDAGCDIVWLRTGQQRDDSEEMIALLQKMGITTPEQLQKFLDVEDIAKDVERLLLSRLRRRKQ